LRVAILGGGNPYALNLACHLSTLGIRAFGIGRSPPKAAPFWLAPSGYEYHHAEIGISNSDVLDILDERKPDVIVNFAAQGEGAVSFGIRSYYFYRTNVLYLAELAEKLANCSYLKRFIQIGSSEVYGTTRWPASESDQPNPGSPYAVSKLAFDQHVLLMRKLAGFPGIVVRPSNCYCPGQQLHRVIPRAIRAGMSGIKMRLEGGGASVKGYLHADDLSRALSFIINAPGTSEIYNVGPKEPVPIRALVETVAELLGKRLEDIANETPPRHGDEARYELSSSRIREELGWVPMIRLRDGIQGMIDWFTVYPELLTMDDSFHLRP
jgi:dTDP-glucose 4,6-dehydratase